jgi:hypothetical protein
MTSPERRRKMQIELYCEPCDNRFLAPPQTPALEVLNRMFDEGPCFTLGEGETFEDMIFGALTSRGAICCPDCAKPVSVSEESLGRAAMDMLARW